MVLVKAKRDEILVPLSAVSGIIERRHTLPILSNVLIERVGGNLSFLATDIEIQIIAKSGLEAAAESHSITVGARKLLDILRALPDSAEVTLQQQDKRLVVKAGRSRFSRVTLRNSFRTCMGHSRPLGRNKRAASGLFFIGCQTSRELALRSPHGRP